MIEALLSQILGILFQFYDTAIIYVYWICIECHFTTTKIFYYIENTIQRKILPAIIPNLNQSYQKITKK
jgi:hypothetical protein